MANEILLEKQEENFTRYPELVQNFFFRKEIVIPLFPKNIFTDNELGEKEIKITSAEQYYDYLSDEFNFWKERDPDNKLESIVYFSRYNNLHSQSTVENYLNQSINHVSSGVLSSKTKLAKEILKYIDKSNHFISGFRMGMLIKSTDSITATPDTFQGFYAAMIFRNAFEYYAQTSKENILTFENNIEEASKSFSELNQNYTKAFLNQEKRLELFANQTNDHFAKFAEKSETQFKDANVRLEKMEELYREKLRLEAPAKYWSKLKTNYSIKGYIWLGISVLCAIVIVKFLLVLLLNDYTILSPDVHWIENFKNSAIITILASIGIYLIRLTTKLALSSYHLSDDARERENLSYFYLALIEKGAVTDKERALVLNALFSRSDTGLLKGDSAPSMPSNITDIIEVLKKNGS